MAGTRILRLWPLAVLLGTASAWSASGDWRQDAPGRVHRIDPRTLPPPYATEAAGNPPDVVDRPAGATLAAPPGFKVQPFAEVRGARVLRVAPNGDVFVSSTKTGNVFVLRTQDGLGRALGKSLFASGLHQPFGIAFWPVETPRYVYVAQIDRLVRFAWHVGATAPDGPAETVLDHLPTGGHWTRDIVVAPGASRLLLSVGSGSNDADGMGAAPKGFVAGHPTGATWGPELRRADVLSLAPDGSDVQIYATGLRNCSGEAIEPATGALWCATNERDGLGDDLPPDYLTSVKQGGYYGWPWYFIGGHPDPNRGSDRPDLADKAIVPDILIQPHSAPLGLAFYTGTMFPAAYRGQGFAALHGSWDRATRTGYKVVSFDPKTNAYSDFLTGFVRDNDAVWGRPVDVAVAHDGALLVSEDANGTIWRVSH